MTPTLSPTKQKISGKRRINLSPDSGDFQFIERIAKRDGVPVAKKTMDLVKLALVIEEDKYFSELAEDVLAQNNPSISSQDFWKAL